MRSAGPLRLARRGGAPPGDLQRGAAGGAAAEGGAAVSAPWPGRRLGDFGPPNKSGDLGDMTWSMEMMIMRPFQELSPKNPAF